MFFAERSRIAALVRPNRLPAIYGAKEFWKRVVSFIRVDIRSNGAAPPLTLTKSKGSQPGRPAHRAAAKVRVAPEHEAAKARLTIPPSLLRGPDEVIE